MKRIWILLLLLISSAQIGRGQIYAGANFSVDHSSSVTAIYKFNFQVGTESMDRVLVTAEMGSGSADWFKVNDEWVGNTKSVMSVGLSSVYIINRSESIMDGGLSAGPGWKTLFYNKSAEQNQQDHLLYLLINYHRGPMFIGTEIGWGSVGIKFGAVGKL